jgi:DNA-binding HxlR family transcriptional regulator
MQDAGNFRATMSRAPCPSDGLLPHLTGKWTLQLIGLLAESPDHRLRFGEIQTALAGISQKVLSSTLRTLERDGLVARHVYADVPPRVEYELTQTGRGFMRVLSGLMIWMTQSWPSVNAARTRYDAARA